MKKPNIYKPPWYATARPWSEIENKFQAYIGAPDTHMLELVSYIIRNDYSNRLFGYTSMDKLIISIYDKIDPLNEALHIEFDQFSNQWIFQYFSGGSTEPEFFRKYSEEMGIDKFTSFINEKIKW